MFVFQIVQHGIRAKSGVKIGFCWVSSVALHRHPTYNPMSPSLYTVLLPPVYCPVAAAPTALCCHYCAWPYATTPMRCPASCRRPSALPCSMQQPCAALCHYPSLHCALPVLCSRLDLHRRLHLRCSMQSPRLASYPTLLCIVSCTAPLASTVPNR